MKITVTGSLGNISKPLTQLLVAQGHTVTVVSSDAAKAGAIATLGAVPAIGSLTDPDFLTAAFSGADAAYVMLPMSYTEADQSAYTKKLIGSYIQSLRSAAVKRIVVLSGWAADLIKSENLEGTFAVLGGASITFLRPAVFYTNFYFSMDLIRGNGLLGAFLTLRHSGLGALLSGKKGLLMGNYGGEDRVVFVSPKDIADAAAEELVISTGAASHRYVGSEEMTCNEAAAIIGKAIGKPWLKWVLLSDQQMLQGLKMSKMPVELAENLVEMQAAMHSGKALQHFHSAHPKMGKVKMPDFAKEFALAYHQK